MAASPELKRVKRHLTARRETNRAVERFCEVDALPGHRVEMLARMRRLKDTVDRAVAVLERGDADEMRRFA